jgi:hypothetical protein
VTGFFDVSRETQQGRQMSCALAKGSALNFQGGEVESLNLRRSLDFLCPKWNDSDRKGCIAGNHQRK